MEINQEITEVEQGVKEYIKKDNGFTLIEIIMVIVVIAILASLSLVVFSEARKKARDTQRITAIQNINKAIQVYITDYGLAPDLGDPACLEVLNPNPSCVADIMNHPNEWTDLAKALEPYIHILPTDPCVNCVSVFTNVAYAQTGLDYNFVYKAPAGIAYDLQQAGLSLDFLDSSTYRIYADKLEKFDGAFGYGYNLHGFFALNNDASVLDELCPLSSKEYCDFWPDLVKKNTEICNSGDLETCIMLARHGLFDGSNVFKCVFNTEEQCAEWDSFLYKNITICNEGERSSCDLLAKYDLYPQITECPLKERDCLAWFEEIQNNLLLCDFKEETACNWLDKNNVFK